MHRNLGSTVTNAESSTNAESPAALRQLASEKVRRLRAKLRRLAACNNRYKTDNSFQGFRNTGFAMPCVDQLLVVGGGGGRRKLHCQNRKPWGVSCPPSAPSAIQSIHWGGTSVFRCLIGERAAGRSSLNRPKRRSPQHSGSTTCDTHTSGRLAAAPHLSALRRAYRRFYTFG
jgi:hypothetical protein